MAQQPFTTDGVNQKLQELYRLSDADLAAQVRSIYADLITWINTNFALTAQQQGYLSSAPALVRQNWAGVVGAAVSAKKPVVLKPPPNYGPPRRTKQIVINIPGDLTWFPPLSGASGIEGNFTVNIDWNLVD